MAVGRGPQQKVFQIAATSQQFFCPPSSTADWQLGDGSNLLAYPSFMKSNLQGATRRALVRVPRRRVHYDSLSFLQLFSSSSSYYVSRDNFNDLINYTANNQPLLLDLTPSP